jgi:uncharacterized protein YbjT (DUF2867 family)
VVQALVQAGYPVRVLSRNPEHAKILLPATVEICQGDLQDRNSLRSAMQGIDAIYINLPETLNSKAAVIPEQHGVQNILEAAPRGALVMKLSVIDATENPHLTDLTLKFRAEETIRASGHPYMIFRPTWFMDSIPLVLKYKNFILYAGTQPSPLYWIAAQDFGKQVVTALQKRPQTENWIFNIQGPDAMTFHDTARRYAAVVDPGLRILQIPLWLLRLSGVVNSEVHTLYKLMAYYDQRVETFQSEDTWDKLGRPTTTIEQFAGQKYELSTNKSSG